ncbi:hypothetical protein MLD38_035821 [Melastoma candidum]|uniref:Uncharacterized protein n=1 Tax=Melastoma candidum TaxID=119954 RepID=A0ACB9LHR1_9MYRT|nr:hypothetical protein MLD38_035821 [Melastoma candidum]
MKSGRPSLPGRRRLPSSAETFLLPVKLAVSGLDSYHDLTCLPLVDSYRTLAMMKVKRISELFPQCLDAVATAKNLNVGLTMILD